MVPLTGSDTNGAHELLFQHTPTSHALYVALHAAAPPAGARASPEKQFAAANAVMTEIYCAGEIDVFRRPGRERWAMFRAQPSLFLICPEHLAVRID